MKLHQIVQIILLLALMQGAAFAREVKLLNPAAPNWQTFFRPTDSEFRCFASPDEPGVLVLEANIRENSPVLRSKAFHGWNLVPPAGKPFPTGTLKFDFRPDSMTTLWINVHGASPEKQPQRLDCPVNLYDTNLAVPGQWNEVEMDLTDAHIIGTNKRGALAAVRLIELRMYPNITEPGVYRAEIRNIRCETGN